MADTHPTPRKKAAQKPEKEAFWGDIDPPVTAEPAPQKKKTGRPSTYDPEIARQMCEQLSEGIPLREICRQEGFPAWRTVYDWIAKDEDLSAHIAHAREVGYDSLAEECLSIADDASNDWMEKFDKDGRSMGWQLNGDHVQRSKLRIETRLKLLAKWNPKKYGDRVQVAGDAENPLQVNADVNLFDAILGNIEAKRQVTNAD